MAAMVREKALAGLDALQSEAHEQFTYEGSAARLEQLDAHMATVRMIVGHLFDEADRHPGKAE
jgi:hypothetical protein